MRYAIVTRMPSTGRMTNLIVREGDEAELAECQASWAETDCVTVRAVTQAQEEALEREWRGE